MKRILLVVLFAAGLWSVAGAADTSITTGSLLASVSQISGVTCVSLDWGSNPDGDHISEIRGVYGEIRRITLAPDTATSQPTNLYNMTLTDRDGFDVLGGRGSNLSNSKTTFFVPLTGDGVTTVTPITVHGSLHLNIDSAGDDKGGTVRLYLR